MIEPLVQGQLDHHRPAATALLHLGFGRIVALEIEVPNMLANLVLSG